MSTPDLAECVRGWSPAPVVTSGSTDAWTVGAVSGLFDLPPVAGDGEDLPPLWHWFGFLDHPRQDQLGDDGHPAQGRFMPPVPHRRRMIAGGRLEVGAPMRVGETLERHSTLRRCDVKSGRSGDMVLVTVRHEFRRDGTTIVGEEQDVVYRSQPPGQARGIALDAPDADLPAPGPEAVALTPDETLLFRFSALTYNTHRIHYDLPYVTQVEGYPGLVVHGPLLALQLLEVPRRHRPGRPVRRFDFRLRRPVFAGQHVVARPAADRSSPEGSDDGLALEAGVPGAPPSVTGTVRGS
ncbi:MaoC family dehydratase N-terminal domain-containing protein [Actinomycetospora lutea]|uniref:FAS1-like dehydratase domain-containing protein n=1 Tax=Actinomycetospora lutea TaxID=663604 RepID=UPI002365BC9B|nr:MaoC family dehydratase N-terminal domain-containing protein [Actinomycetospora lutea]MDD7941258.1 MaoC family dehydratase N-terminal domain-containing protein [Actinomycetospora lutea]